MHINVLPHASEPLCTRYEASPAFTPRVQTYSQHAPRPTLPFHATQCLANHVNPFDFLPAPYKGRAPLKCPCCSVVVDNALMEKEAKEREGLTPSQLEQKCREHRASHKSAMHGKRPVVPSDNRCRSRGVLHRRMNVTSNCLAATVMKVTFNEKKRIAANALLDKARMIWRVPEKSKTRAKTISAGNDARRLLSDAELLCGLLEIFYPEEWGGCQRRQRGGESSRRRRRQRRRANGGDGRGRGRCCHGGAGGEAQRPGAQKPDRAGTSWRAKSCQGKGQG